MIGWSSCGSSAGIHSSSFGRSTRMPSSLSASGFRWSRRLPGRVRRRFVQCSEPPTFFQTTGSIRWNPRGVRSDRCQRGLRSHDRTYCGFCVTSEGASSHRKAVGCEAGSRAERELDALATLVEAYSAGISNRRVVADRAIKVRCEELAGRARTRPIIGSRARVRRFLLDVACSRCR